MIGELWWNRLVNSVRFLDDIQIAVMNEKSVVLFSMTRFRGRTS